MKIIIHLSHSTIRRNAMIEQGINPAAMAIKPGSRVERNRKHLSKNGSVKHKGRAFDC